MLARPATAATLLALTLMLAACGDTPQSKAQGGEAIPSAPSSSAGPVVTAAAPEEVPEPSEEAPGQGSPEGGSHEAPYLEALLPSEAGGVKFTKTSFTGSDDGIVGPGATMEDLQPILDKFGKTEGDIGFATAMSEETAVMVFQIRGVPASEFLDAVSQMRSRMEEKTIAGKHVLAASAGGISVVTYLKDDLLFEIMFASDEVTEAILSQLP